MLVLCVLSRHKGKMQDSQDTETNTDELQTEYKRIHTKKLPVGARFSTLVQTGPGAHPASCTMGTASFPGVNRPGLVANYLPLCSVEVKERVATLYCPSWTLLPVIV